MQYSPINYNIDVQTPFQSMLQGYQAGAAIRDDQAAQAQKQVALQQQQTMASDLRALSMNPNASGADYAAMMTRYPALAESLTKAWAPLDETQKQNKLNSGTQVYSAIASGRNDIAANLLRQQAAAKRNSGHEQDAARDEAMAQTIEQHPEVARNMIGMGLSAIMGPEKFATTFAALGKEGRDAAAAPVDLRIKTAEAITKEAEAANAPEKLRADIANVKSQISDRARRLALDEDKLTSETQLKLYELQQKNGELPEHVSKGINEAATDAIAAEQSAGKMDRLADELDAAGGGYGGLSSAGEWLKRATGNQNEMTRLRAEYSRIVTPAAMGAYKKVASGSTSDRDIETAMKGVPSDTADSNEMASFLRGMAKLQRIDGVLSNAKSEWLGANKHLGKTARDIEIDGVKVPAGTTFKSFADQYVEGKLVQQQAEQNAKTVQSRPYMSAATAPPAQAPAEQPAQDGPSFLDRVGSALAPNFDLHARTAISTGDVLAMRQLLATPQDAAKPLSQEMRTALEQALAGR